jgi:transposase
MPRTRPAYPEEFRREAVQFLRAGRTPRELAKSLGVSEQTLRNWRRQEQVDRHERDDGITTDERAELARLRRENARRCRSATCSSEPRPSSQRRTGPGDAVPVDLGAEGPNPDLHRVRAARRLTCGLLRLGEPASRQIGRCPTRG